MAQLAPGARLLLWGLCSRGCAGLAGASVDLLVCSVLQNQPRERLTCLCCSSLTVTALRVSWAPLSSRRSPGTLSSGTRTCRPPLQTHLSTTFPLHLPRLQATVQLTHTVSNVFSNTKRVYSLPLLGSEGFFKQECP